MVELLDADEGSMKINFISPKAPTYLKSVAIGYSPVPLNEDNPNYDKHEHVHNKHDHKISSIIRSIVGRCRSLQHLTISRQTVTLINLEIIVTMEEIALNAASEMSSSFAFAKKDVLLQGKLINKIFWR